MALTYRPWVPKAGMGGWFRHLVQAWGNPNAYDCRWPKPTLEAVCERGEAKPLTYDENGSSRVYFFRPPTVSALGLD